MNAEKPIKGGEGRREGGLAFQGSGVEKEEEEDKIAGEHRKDCSMKVWWQEV